MLLSFVLLLYAILRKSQALHRKFTSPTVRLLLDSTSPSALTRCHLPYRGEALAGRFTSYWTPEVRQDVKGRALLAGAAASGQRSLSSCRWPRQRSTAASETSRFARPDESWPTCQGLPLWGSWRAQARLRGQGCCQTALRSDRIAPTKSLPIAARWLSGDRLALSVTPVACHLSQRERLWHSASLPVSFCRSL